MLPAEMVDGTRAQVQRRREEEEAAGEGDANPAPNPEVVLPNNQDGYNPLVIPDREEDETRDEYAVRVMQAVSQHQINSFHQMIQSMKDISKEVKKKKSPSGKRQMKMKIQMIQTIKMPLKDQKYEESGKESKLPFSRE